MTENSRRFFIVSSGRAGSTLCSAIFAQAGADFGFSELTEWDRRAGAFELKEESYAAEHHNRAVALKDNSHISRLQMWRRKYHRSKAKANARRLLEKTQWVKLSNSGVVKLARTLDYQPTVILLYRPFEDYALSSFLRSGRNYSQMVEHYYNTYTTALVSLKIYGGCIIEYDEIVDRGNTAWIERVAQVTSLDSAELIAARDKIVDSSTAQEEPFVVEDPRLQQVADAIAQYRGKILPPHRLAQRRA